MAREVGDLSERDLPPFVSDGSPAAEAFAVAYANPDFRLELWCRGLGLTGARGRDIVVAGVDEPLISVLNRLPGDGTVLLATPDPDATFGWSTVWLDPLRDPIPAEAMALLVTERDARLDQFLAHTKGTDSPARMPMSRSDRAFVLGCAMLAATLATGRSIPGVISLVAFAVAIRSRRSEQ